MNLKKLFDMQKKLDEKILERFSHLRNEDLLPKKILALQVELGELCNCWRGFKFWSDDQEPRTQVYSFDEWKKSGFKTDENGKPINCYKNPLLEEYVDCLYFILSIGLDLRMDEVADELDFEYACRDIIDCFVYLNSDVTDLYYVRENDDVNSDFYESLFSKFIRLGELLGFTWEQIEKAYLEKNEVNHERQESGY